MSPLADAMGLVDHQTSHAGPLERVPERAAPETLGGDVEQRQAARREVRLDGAALLGREPAVQGARRDAARPQRVHLILHEGDERRHHDRGAREQQRGKLEAERLAGTGRHDGHEVATAEDRERRLALAGAEGLEPEAVAQTAVERAVEGFEVCGGRHP